MIYSNVVPPYKTAAQLDADLEKLNSSEEVTDEDLSELYAEQCVDNKDISEDDQVK